MPESQATTAHTGPVFPPGRYGRRREPRKRRRGIAILAAITVIAVTLIATVSLYRRYGDPAYDPEVIGYTQITDTQIVITFRVNLPAGKDAVCAVRARSRDGAVVGRAEVPVPAGSTRTSYRLTTTARPFVGEVVRCRAAAG